MEEVEVDMSANDGGGGGTVKHKHETMKKKSMNTFLVATRSPFTMGNVTVVLRNRESEKKNTSKERFLCFSFLDAPSHLQKRVCPSVRPYVRVSVRQHYEKCGISRARRILCRVSGLVEVSP